MAVGAFPNDLVVAPDGTTGYVVSSGSNRIDVIDLDRVIGRSVIDLGSGTSPYSLALAGAGDAYVSSWMTNDVAHVDLTAGRVVNRTPVGRGPEGVLFVATGGERGSPAGVPPAGDLYVTVTNYVAPYVYDAGEVVVMSVPVDTVRARLRVGINPQSLALAPDGRIHVVCTGDYGPNGGVEGELFVIDPEVPAVVDSVALGGSPVAAVPLSRDRGCTAGFTGGLRIYDLASRTASEANAIRGAEFLTAMAFDPVSGLLYVSDFDDDRVYVVDAGADTLVTSFATGDGPIDLAVRR
jgi:DNA-binding beta-propeller fold protein YncE